MFILTAFNKETETEEQLIVSGDEVFISRKSGQNGVFEVCKGEWAARCLADIATALKKEEQP